MSEMIGTTIQYILIMHMFITGVLFFNYFVTQDVVQETVYNYTQISGKQGKMSNVVYKNMMNDLNRMSDFEVKIVAKNYIDDTETPVVIDGMSVIGKDLRELDFETLEILVISKNPAPISYFLNAITLKTDYRYYGKTAVYIK